jgi:hypothetical protein
MRAVMLQAATAPKQQHAGSSRFVTILGMITLGSDHLL